MFIDVREAGRVHVPFLLHRRQVLPRVPHQIVPLDQVKWPLLVHTAYHVDGTAVGGCDCLEVSARAVHLRDLAPLVRNRVESSNGINMHYV